jgi:hypothetical protein
MKIILIVVGAGKTNLRTKVWLSPAIDTYFHSSSPSHASLTWTREGKYQVLLIEYSIPSHVIRWYGFQIFILTSLQVRDRHTKNPHPLSEPSLTTNRLGCRGAWLHTLRTADKVLCFLLLTWCKSKSLFHLLSKVPSYWRLNYHRLVVRHGLYWQASQTIKKPVR